MSMRSTYPVQDARPVTTVCVASGVAAEFDTIRSVWYLIVAARLLEVRHGGESRAGIIRLFTTHERSDELLKLVNAIMDTVRDFGL